MIILDILLVIVFALIAVAYGLRASRQRAAGDPKARWSVVTCVLFALAAVAWGASLVIQAS